MRTTWRKIVAWGMLALPAGYWIGMQFEYTIYALLAALGYMTASVYLLFWEELTQKKPTSVKEETNNE